MQISKWGNSLAVRLPASLVRSLNLKEGDNIELFPNDEGYAVVRTKTAEEVLADLKQFRGRLSGAQHLTREEANGR